MLPQARRGLLVVVGAAVLMTVLNGVKPLHIDDPFSYRIAEQIVRHPADPYGFDILWIQWPQPVHEELTPPVVPYWWALALAAFGKTALAWKLWLLPFALLLSASLWTLLRRFARGTEIPLLLLTVFSPAFLPAFNFMQDVPAQALGLTALCLYLAACDRDSLALAGAAGLVAGLAAQTKYTAVGVLVVMALDALLFRRLRAALVAIGVALAVFAGWESLMTLRYGQGMFLGQLGSPLWVMERSAMVVPLLRLTGGAAPLVVVLGLSAIGLPRDVVLGLCAAGLAAYGMLFALPVDGLLYPVLGGLAVLSFAGAAARLTRLGRGKLRAPWSARRVDWLLVGWLVSEVVLYFAAAPFPAVRRVMGVIVAATFVVARLAALGLRARPRAIPLNVVAVCGVALGLLFWVVDLREARVQRDAPHAALRAIRAIDPDARVWYVGHWGFQHYAEEAGLRPVIPDVSRLAAGDWIVVPDRVHQQEITLDPADVERREVLQLSDALPLTTGHGYYANATPLAHLAAPRLSLTLLRVGRDVVPRTAWPPEQLLRWARYAGGQTAAAAVPALRRLLEEPGAHARVIGAMALGELGPRAAAASGDLRGSLRDRDASVRQQAALALGRIGDAAADQDLRALLDDPVAEVRQAASEALARLSR